MRRLLLMGLMALCLEGNISFGAAEKFSLFSRPKPEDFRLFSTEQGSPPVRTPPVSPPPRPPVARRPAPVAPPIFYQRTPLFVQPYLAAPSFGGGCAGGG